jgi:ankyrin repeat protein
MQYLKEKKDDGVIAGVAKEIEHMLARGQLDLPITLCFAASRSDEFVLHQLLKRGLDPNETDNNGRTALVIQDTLLDNLFLQYVNLNYYILCLNLKVRMLILLTAYSSFQWE